MSSTLQTVAGGGSKSDLVKGVQQVTQNQNNIANAQAAAAQQKITQGGANANLVKGQSNTYFDVDSKIKAIYSDFLNKGGQKSQLSLPNAYGNSVRDVTQASRIVNDYLNKANSVLKSNAPKPTYDESINKSLKSVYDEYIKNGGDSSKIQKPQTYSNITDQAKAQKLLSDYTTAANSALKATAEAKVSYDNTLNKAVSNVFNSYLNAGGDPKRLQNPTGYSGIKSQAEAQKILDSFTAQANAALQETASANVSYDVNGTLQKSYESLVNSGYGNVPSPTLTNQTISSQSQAQKLVDDYYDKVNSSAVDPETNLNKMIVSGDKEGINKLGSLPNFYTNVNPEKGHSDYQFLSRLDGWDTQKYFNMKAAGVVDNEYDFRVMRGINTITVKGNFSPLTDDDAVHESGRSSGTGSTRSALANPVVAQIMSNNQKISTSALVSQLAGQTPTKVTVVGKDTLLTPSAQSDLIRLGNSEITKSIVSNVKAVNNNLPISQQIDNKQAIQKIEDKTGLKQNKSALDNASVKKQIEDNSKLSASQIMNNINHIKSVSSEKQDKDWTVDDIYGTGQSNKTIDLLSKADNKGSAAASIANYLPKEANAAVWGALDSINTNIGNVLTASGKFLQEHSAKNSQAAVTGAQLIDRGTGDTLGKITSDVAFVGEKYSQMRQKLKDAEGDMGLNYIPTAKNLNLSDSINKGLNTVSDTIGLSAVGNTIKTAADYTPLKNNPTIQSIKNSINFIDSGIKTINSGTSDFLADQYDAVVHDPIGTAFDVALTKEAGKGLGMQTEALTGLTEKLLDSTAAKNIGVISKAAGLASKAVRPAINLGLTGAVGIDAIKTVQNEGVKGGLNFAKDLLIGGEGYKEGIAEQKLTNERIADSLGKIGDNINKIELKSLRNDESAQIKLSKNAEPVENYRLAEVEPGKYDLIKVTDGEKSKPSNENTKSNQNIESRSGKQVLIQKHAEPITASEKASPRIVDLKHIGETKEIAKEKIAAKMDAQKQARIKSINRNIATIEREKVDLTSRYAQKEKAKLNELGTDRKMTVSQRKAYEAKLKDTLRDKLKEPLDNVDKIHETQPDKEVMKGPDEGDKLKNKYEDKNHEKDVIRGPDKTPEKDIDKYKEKEISKYKPTSDIISNIKNISGISTLQKQNQPILPSQRQPTIIKQTPNQVQNQTPAQTIKQSIKNIPTQVPAQTPKQAQTPTQIPTQINPYKPVQPLKPDIVSPVNPDNKPDNKPDPKNPTIPDNYPIIKRAKNNIHSIDNVIAPRKPGSNTKTDQGYKDNIKEIAKIGRLIKNQLPNLASFI